MTSMGTTVVRALTAAFLLLIFSYSSAEEKRYVVPLDDSPSCGPANAAVTVVEFLDYQ